MAANRYLPVCPSLSQAGMRRSQPAAERTLAQENIG
jgi:hypothetical protein